MAAVLQLWCRTGSSRGGHQNLPKPGLSGKCLSQFHSLIFSHFWSFLILMLNKNWGFSEVVAVDFFPLYFSLSLFFIVIAFRWFWTLRRLHPTKISASRWTGALARIRSRQSVRIIRNSYCRVSILCELSMRFTQWYRPPYLVASERELAPCRGKSFGKIYQRSSNRNSWGELSGRTDRICWESSRLESAEPTSGRSGWFDRFIGWTEPVNFGQKLRSFDSKGDAGTALSILSLFWAIWTEV